LISRFRVVRSRVVVSLVGGSFDLTRYERRLQLDFKASRGGFLSLEWTVGDSLMCGQYLRINWIIDLMYAYILQGMHVIELTAKAIQYRYTEG